MGAEAQISAVIHRFYVCGGRREKHLRRRIVDALRADDLAGGASRQIGNSSLGRYRHWYPVSAQALAQIPDADRHGTDIIRADIAGSAPAAAAVASVTVLSATATGSSRLAAGRSSLTASLTGSDLQGRLRFPSAAVFPRKQRRGRVFRQSMITAVLFGEDGGQGSPWVFRPWRAARA